MNPRYKKILISASMIVLGGHAIQAQENEDAATAAEEVTPSRKPIRGPVRLKPESAIRTTTEAANQSEKPIRGPVRLKPADPVDSKIQSAIRNILAREGIPFKRSREIPNDWVLLYKEGKKHAFYRAIGAHERATETDPRRFKPKPAPTLGDLRRLINDKRATINGETDDKLDTQGDQKDISDDLSAPATAVEGSQKPKDLLSDK